MDVREKLVELLEKQKGYTLPIWMESQTIEIMADALIAHGVTVQEWISVKDRLPEEGGYYLICQKDKSWFDEVIQTARWNKVTHSFRGAQAGCIMEFVTHWAPLPQPPEGE